MGTFSNQLKLCNVLFLPFLIIYFQVLNYSLNFYLYCMTNLEIRCSVWPPQIRMALVEGVGLCQPFIKRKSALKLIFGNEFATWILVLANSQQKISFSTAALNQKSHKMTKGNCLLSNLKEEKIVQTQDLKFSNNLALQARCWSGFQPFEASLDLLMY